MKSLGGDLKIQIDRKNGRFAYIASSILHTETVVAVQELARFRKRALPSHFLLNCAITWRHHKGKYHYTKVENGPFSVVIGTYLTVAKAEKHSHAETLGKRNYILPRCISSSKRNVSEENSRLGNLLQFLAHERRGSSFSSINFQIFTANEL